MASHSPDRLAQTSHTKDKLEERNLLTYTSQIIGKKMLREGTPKKAL